MAIDSSNNIYITGRYTSTANVTVKNVSGNTQTDSSITLPITTGGSVATILIKYNSSGTALWATYLDGTSTDTGYALAIDSSDNIYITGVYNSTANVTIKNVSDNTQTNTSITLPITLSTAAFLIKYNSSGIAQWATYLDGTSSDAGNSLAIDSSNNIYITGSYTSSANVTIKNVSDNTQTDSSIILPTPATAGTAAFLIKYDSSGVAQWATLLDGTSADGGNSLAIDLLNNIYITGYYNSTVNVTVKNVSGNTQTNSSVTLPITTGGSNAAFLVKYDSSGTALWATYLDGASSDIGNSLLMDQNAIYLSGSYSSTPTLKNVSGNTQTNSSVTLPGQSVDKMFLIKYT